MSFEACKNKNPALHNAIFKFCSNTDIRIPSTYAANGVISDSQFGSDKWVVTIHGATCDNQLVPKPICQQQFMDMCASGGPEGANLQHSTVVRNGRYIGGQDIKMSKASS